MCFSLACHFVETYREVRGKERQSVFHSPPSDRSLQRPLPQMRVLGSMLRAGPETNNPANPNHSPSGNPGLPCPFSSPIMCFTLGAYEMRRGGRGSLCADEHWSFA